MALFGKSKWIPGDEFVIDVDGKVIVAPAFLAAHRRLDNIVLNRTIEEMYASRYWSHRFVADLLVMMENTKWDEDWMSYSWAILDTKTHQVLPLLSTNNTVVFRKGGFEWFRMNGDKFYIQDGRVNYTFKNAAEEREYHRDMMGKIYRGYGMMLKSYNLAVPVECSIPVRR